MAGIVYENKKKILIVSNNRVRRDFKDFFNGTTPLLLLALIVSLVSIAGWLVLFFMLSLSFYRKIYSKYLYSGMIFDSYLLSFTNVARGKGDEVFTVIGYEIDIDEWNAHRVELRDVSIHPNATDDEIEKMLPLIQDGLSGKANRISKHAKYREFGVSKDMITRHLVFLGTTGAGKTETLMSFFIDVLKNGGGIIFIDGKADNEMNKKLYALASSLNRATSYNVINFLKSEKHSDTNTYSPILTMQPKQAMSFMASLLGESDGGGNHDYFKSRGVAMKATVLSGLKLRLDYYDEPFSLSLIQSTASSTINMSIQFSMIYGIIKEENDRLAKLIESDRNAKIFWEEVKNKSTAVIQDLFYYEKILNYVIQYKPSAKIYVEELIGYSFDHFYRVYEDCFKPLYLYIQSVFSEWNDMAKAVSHLIYSLAKSEGRSFLYTKQNCVTIEDMRGYFNRLTDLQEFEKALEKVPRYFEQDNDVSVSEVIKVSKRGLGLEKNSVVSLKQMPENNITQHNYAIQQWGALYKTFADFTHVFGVPYPDVDINDIIKNNKILYVLLPVLELGKADTMTLALMLTRNIEVSASVALGGEKLSISNEQEAIMKDKITPKPLTLIVLDEKGSYRVPISNLVSQVRSINLGVIVSAQDVDSLRVDGNDSEMNRLMANTAKLLLRTYDPETMKFFDDQIKDIKRLDSKVHLASDGSLQNTLGSDTEIKDEKPFDAKDLGDMMYGCGAYIAGSDVSIVQSYYRGGEKKVGYIGTVEKVA